MDEIEAMLLGDVLWWHADKRNQDRVLSTLTADFRAMSDLNDRIPKYDLYASFYVNRRFGDDMTKMLTTEQAKVLLSAGKYSRVPYNLMKQVIDEVTARIIKSHPRAQFLPNGADQEIQRRAEMMERWNDSQVYQHYQSEIFEDVIKDACLYGLGALKIVPSAKESRLDVRRVHPSHLFVDMNETIDKKPTRLHLRNRVKKDTLKLFYPKFADAIDKATRIESIEQFEDHYPETGDAQSQTIDIIQSWHLPSFKGAKDGRYITWISSAIIGDEDYQRRAFPLCFFNWKKDPTNTFYGVGLAEDLLGIHLDANVTLNRVNTAIEKAAVPRMAYREGSIADAHIRAISGLKTPYTGDTPPTYYLDNSVPQDLLMYVREHEARAYKIAGLGSAQAFGERVPSGVETGRAVENFFNVESVPFATQLRKFEYFIEDVANANVAAGKEVSERDPKWNVVLQDDRNVIESIPWKDIAMDPREDSFVIRAVPGSMLPELPAARLNYVQQLIALVPSIQANEQLIVKLLGVTDIKNFRDMFSAQQENGEAMINEALRNNKYTAPSPFMNLQQFIIDATDAEQRASRMKVAEPNLATLRRMIRVANALQQQRTIAREMQAMGGITPASMPTNETGVQPGTPTRGQLQ